MRHTKKILYDFEFVNFRLRTLWKIGEILISF